MKILIFLGFLEKSNFGTAGGSHKKTIYRGIPSKGDLDSFQILRRGGGLAKKRGVIFRGSDTPLHTMQLMENPVLYK